MRVTNMQSQTVVRWSLFGARILGGFVFVGGLTGLLGWIVDIKRLAGWDGSDIVIQPNNTVCMMLGGIGLVLLASGRERLGALLGMAAGAIGLATFSQYLLPINFGIDGILLFGREWGKTGTVVHGRMGPPASLSWTLLGCGFLLLFARRQRFVPFLAMAVLLIASISFIGYLFGADRLYTLPRLTVIAWQTSAFLIALSVGLLAALPGSKPISYVVEDSVTGMLLRRLLLPIMVIPLALGAFRVAGQNLGYYDTAMGTALLIILLIGLFLLFMFLFAGTSSRFETAKRQADLVAEAAADELSLVTETASVGLVHVSRDLVYLSANSTYAGFVGKPLEFVVGQRMENVIGREAVARIRPHFERALAGESVNFEVEFPFDAPREKQRWLHVAYTPASDADGNVSGWVACTTDVSQRKRDEQAAEDSRRTLYEMIENAPFGVYVVDSDFRIAVVNKGSQERAFVNVNPAVGKPLDEAMRVLWPEDVADDVIKNFRHTLKTGEPYFSKDFVNLRADIEQVEGYEWELHQIKMRDGSNGVICYYFDSTELRTAQMELADLNRELEDRVAARTEALSNTNVALNQEMHARVALEQERISVLSRMMSAQEDERRRIAAELHDQLGQHMTALRLRLNALWEQAAGKGLSDSIDNIVQIAKELDDDLDAVTLSLRPRALDTLGLAEALGDYVCKWQDKSGIAAEFHSTGYREGLLSAQTETAVFRITQEALNNCAKHSEAQSVNVVLGIREMRLTLVIEDNGKGFDLECLAGDEGLGLTSMRERCEMAGGSFTVESEKARGTTIIVTIPIK